MQSANSAIKSINQPIIQPNAPLSLQGFAGELDVDAELERMEGGGRGGGGRGGRQQQHKPGERFAPRDKSAKREQRDSK